MTRASRRHKPPGTSPGVPVLTGEALPPRVHVIRYTAAAIEEFDVPSAEVCRTLSSGGGVIWIDVQGLGDLELLQVLGETFGLHPLALEDVVSVGQRPKMEDYDTHIFVIARMAEPGGLTTDQTSIFLGRDFVVTFQERYGDCLGPVRERLRRGKGLLRRSGPDYLAYAILDAIIDGYFPILERWGEMIDDLEHEVTRNPTRASLGRLHTARRGIQTMRRAVSPMRDAVSTLIRDEDDLVTPQTRVYLRDCHDHAVQIMEILSSYQEQATGLMEIYLSSLSQRLNEVMKVLTIISTIFIPLTFVVGVYGMNFDHMPELHWRYGYPAVMAGMGVLGLLMVWYFARKGWIGGGQDRPASRRAGNGAGRKAR
jgi:magnesium transporter